MGLFSGPKAHKIVGKGFLHEGGVWGRWMTSVAELVHEFGHLNDDPFAYNETATVSLLIGAATRIDLLALAEFVSTKKLKRVPITGRCDLWLCSDRRSWAFEVKQKKYRGGFHRPKTVLGWLNEACEDARKLTHHEAEKRFGLLVISTFGVEHLDPRFLESLDEVFTMVDYAWQILPDSDVACQTFLLFKEVHKKRKRQRQKREGASESDA